MSASFTLIVWFSNVLHCGPLQFTSAVDRQTRGPASCAGERNSPSLLWSEIFNSHETLKDQFSLSGCWRSFHSLFLVMDGLVFRLSSHFTFKTWRVMTALWTWPVKFIWTKKETSKRIWSRNGSHQFLLQKLDSPLMTFIFICKMKNTKYF